jgi:putative PIN family toxin of toxin-antitoxin system
VIRVVLDPNVIVAAAIRPGGVCARCLRAHAEGRFELVVSPRLLAELRTVLQRERFRPFLTTAQAESLVDALARDASVVADPGEAAPISRAPGDDYLIALARSARAHVLVSGDDDLLSLDLSDLGIVSPRAFIERLAVG